MTCGASTALLLPAAAGESRLKEAATEVAAPVECMHLDQTLFTLRVNSDLLSPYAISMSTYHLHLFSVSSVLASMC